VPLMKKRYVLFLLVLFSFVGCETLKGMGKDLENTGGNIQEAAEKLEKKVE
jgi:predicted small secreted protein